MMPDPQHLIKNIRNQLWNNKVIWIDQKYVDEFKLPTNRVTKEAIARVYYHCDANNELKICPRLTEKCLNVDKYSKMKVNLARNALSKAVAQGIEFCVANFPDKFPKEDLTTAFFVFKVAEWYEVMTHKGMNLALSKKNPEKYEKTVKDLHWFSTFYASMKLHAKQQGGLKPTQVGVLLATFTATSLTEYFLDDVGVKFVPCGKLNNDPIENLNSVARRNNPKPTCLEYTRRLKAISMCQILKGASHSSYDDDGTEGFLTDLKEYKESLKEVEAEERLDDEDQRFTNAAIEIVINNNFAEDNALAYLCGHVLMKTVATQSQCTICETTYLTNDVFEIQECNALIRLKDFLPGALRRPSDFGNELWKSAEVVFRIERGQLEFQDRMGDKLTEKFLNQWNREFSTLPKCHWKLIASRYAKMRLHFWSGFSGEILKKQQKGLIEQSSHASKSIRAIHLLK